MEEFTDPSRQFCPLSFIFTVWDVKLTVKNTAVKSHKQTKPIIGFLHIQDKLFFLKIMYSIFNFFYYQDCKLHHIADQ